MVMQPEALFINAVVYLKGGEAYTNLVSYRNLESLGLNDGSQLVALRVLQAPIS